MERMHERGEQDTWAEWKAAVNGLSPERQRRYLADVEGWTPAHIAEYRAGSATALPEEWATASGAHRALDRLFAFARDDDHALRERRAAAVPENSGAEERPPAPQRIVVRDEAHPVESNASGYGSAALPGRDP